MAEITTLIDTHTVVHDFLFQSSAGSTDFNDRIGATDFAGFDGSGGLFEQAGVASVPGDLAFDNEGTFWARVSTTYDTGGSTGTVMLIVKIPSAHSSSLTLFARGNATTGSIKNVITISNTGDVRGEFRVNGTSNRYVVDADLSINDDEYHMVFLTQPGDATGINFHIDGVEITARALDLLTGSATVDEWFDSTSGSVNRTSLFRAPAVADTAVIDATLSRLTFFSDVLTNAEMTAIYDQWVISGPQFASKTIRRQGRKLFFDYTTL